MAFNLKKHAQVPTDSITPSLVDATQDVTESVEDPSKNQFETNDIVNSVNDEDRTNILGQEQNIALWQGLQEMILSNPLYANTKDALLNHPEVKRLAQNLSTSNMLAVKEAIAEAGLGGSSALIPGSENVKVDLRTLKGYIDRLNSSIKDQNTNNTSRLQNSNFINRPLSTAAAFNFRKYKIAQQLMTDPSMNPTPMQQPSQEQQFQTPVVEQSNFPVANIGDFVNKFLDPLLSWNGQKGPEDDVSNKAVSEIQGAVGQGFEQEANSALQSIQQMDPVLEKDKAEQTLIYIYQNWLTPMAKGSQEQELAQTMAKNKDTRTVHLSHQVLNNQTGFVKTAADHFGQEYMLYGPTEKRICPKLRGKNMGDVVSEYTCRHHCLDGIVIDDNKTICGEALWRANVMDKFTREYVDENGDTVGGYLNKRFEINRNVPEENKMRLKPGEMRKPRPASWGNTESRLQDMRNKEGEKRDYRPDVNTGTPFNWSKDQDQNNVQVAQSERDRRETSTGHKLVEYTNKDNQENKPKKQAFNLSKFKTAQFDHPDYVNENTHNPSDPNVISFVSILKQIDNANSKTELDLLVAKAADVIKIPRHWDKLHQHVMNRRQQLGLPTGSNSSSSSSNVVSKTAQLIPDDGFADGGEPYSDEEMDLMQPEDQQYQEPQNPEEEDVTFQDWNGPFFQVGGRMIAQDIASLKHWYDTGNFYPNIWFISDHGNAHLTSWDKVFADLNQPTEDKSMTAPIAPVGNGMSMASSTKGFNFKNYKQAKKSEPSFQKKK